MMTAVAKVMVEREVTVKIVPDQMPENPREFCTLGHMVCWHNRYNLGDEQPSSSTSGEEWLKENAPKGSVVLPLFLLDHSGLRMKTGSFHDPWDSGRVGFIVCTPDKIRKEYNCKRISKKVREQVVKILEQEVKIYDDYLSGNVWGFTLDDAEGEHVDLCFGFYGDDLEGMICHAGEEYRGALTEAWSNRGY